MWTVISVVSEFTFVVLICHIYYIWQNRPVKWSVVLEQPEAKVPVYANPGDAGADICATKEYMVLPGEVVAVETGLRWSTPNGYEVQIRPRSGLAARDRISVLNTPGTIDSGYRGQIKVLIYNHGSVPFEITPGMKIAQAVVSKLVNVKLVESQTLSDTKRGSGGFGSTGT